MTDEDFTPGAHLDRMAEMLSKPEDLLRQIGVMLVAESQAAFRDQKLGSVEWKPRRVPNVMGIIADLHAGRAQPASRRFEARPALRDTGRLVQSIAYRLAGSHVVEAGSNLDYAGKVHKGGKSESKPLTEQVRTALAKFLRGPGKPWRRHLGWLLNRKFAGKTIETDIPARPIVGLTRQTIEDVRTMLGVRISEAK